MKKCIGCGIEKELSEFHKDSRTKGGLKPRCRACMSLRRALPENVAKGKEYYNRPETKLKELAWRKNPEYIKKQRISRYKQSRATLEAWVGFIPKIANCGVCNKIIYFNEGKKKEAIHFDHRYGDNLIPKPTMWLRDHPRTPENEAIWRSCNFGMLCCDCNKIIPTKNRKEFLQKLTEYFQYLKEKKDV